MLFSGIINISLWYTVHTLLLFFCMFSVLLSITYLLSHHSHKQVTPRVEEGATNMHSITLSHKRQHEPETTPGR